MINLKHIKAIVRWIRRHLRMDFYSGFKRFKNKLGTYNKKLCVLWALDKIHFSENNFDEAHKTGMYPWEFLTFIQWTLEYAEQKYPPRQPTEDEIRKLINQLKSLEVSGERFIEDEPEFQGLKWIRIVGKHQQIFQRKCNLWTFGQQVQIFEKIPSTFNYQAQFEAVSGIPLKVFLEHLHFLFLIFTAQKSYSLKKDQILPLLKDSSYLSEVLDFISIDLNNESQYIAQLKNLKVKKPQFQEFDYSLFLKYPLMKVSNNDYIIVSKHVFYESIRWLIYDTVRESDPAKFGQHFGMDSFQEYIRQGLDSSNVSYVDDNHLRSLYGDIAQPDFVIPDTNATILMECKSFEAAPMVRVNPTNLNMRSYYKDQIVKGLTQCYNIANVFTQQPPSFFKSTNFFAVIVTFKDMFLGMGHHMWDEFIEHGLSQYLSSQGISASLIPKDNIFCISLEEFERLIAVNKIYKVPLAEIFQRAARSNTDKSTSKFVFTWHLEKYGAMKFSENSWLWDVYD